MKRINYLVVMLIAALSLVACGQVSYKKTKSGLVYKIIPGKGKDSVRNAKAVKFNFIYKQGDSVIYNSYDKMPGFARIQADDPRSAYSLLEILPLMKEGDSGIIVQMSDTLVKMQQLPPGTKKGTRMVTTFRILKVYDSDSVALADYTREQEKDAPRREKEQQEQMAKMQKSMKEQVEKELRRVEQSGEGARQRKVVEDYLAAKKIAAQKTPKGTFVVIKEQGTGAQAAPGKYVTIKYTGRKLATDSVFESSTYPSLQLGMSNVIEGWEDGLLMFREGGKGTLYIPGYLAYGQNPRPGSPFGPNEALIFDVEILKVSDKADAPPPPQVQPQQ